MKKLRDILYGKRDAISRCLYRNWERELIHQPQFSMFGGDVKNDSLFRGKKAPVRSENWKKPLKEWGGREGPLLQPPEEKGKGTTKTIKMGLIVRIVNSSKK